MGQLIDISAKITNELPCIRIMPDMVVTVNNRKSTVLCIQAMADEAERKRKQGEEVSDDNFMKKTLEMLIGKKNSDAIEKLDLPIPEYKELFQTVMDVATGEYGQTPSQNGQ